MKTCMHLHHCLYVCNHRLREQYASFFFLSACLSVPYESDGRRRTVTPSGEVNEARPTSLGTKRPAPFSLAASLLRDIPQSPQNRCTVSRTAGSAKITQILSSEHISQGKKKKKISKPCESSRDKGIEERDARMEARQLAGSAYIYARSPASRCCGCLNSCAFEEARSSGRAPRGSTSSKKQHPPSGSLGVALIWCWHGAQSVRSSCEDASRPREARLTALQPHGGILSRLARPL